MMNFCPTLRLGRYVGTSATIVSPRLYAIVLLIIFVVYDFRDGDNFLKKRIHLLFAQEKFLLQPITSGERYEKYITKHLEYLGEDDIALGPHLDVKTWFGQVWGPSAMSSSPRSFSSSRYHEVKKKEVSRITKHYFKCLKRCDRVGSSRRRLGIECPE